MIRAGTTAATWKRSINEVNGSIQPHHAPRSSSEIQCKDDIEFFFFDAKGIVTPGQTVNQNLFVSYETSVSCGVMEIPLSMAKWSMMVSSTKCLCTLPWVWNSLWLNMATLPIHSILFRMTFLVPPNEIDPHGEMFCRCGRGKDKMTELLQDITLQEFRNVLKGRKCIWTDALIQIKSTLKEQERRHIKIN